MAITQEQYFKSPDETIDQYNLRIAGLRAAETPTSTINSDVLNSQTDLSSQISFTQTPTEEKASSLEVPSGPTQTETKFETGLDQLGELNKALSGETSFRAEQEQQAGLAESQQTFDDLGQRLRDLQKQEQAIPLQIQEESLGRGRTTGGIAPLQAGELRKNAIQALTVSSLIDAASNRLVSAQRKVDRAVSAKFNPLIAQKEALLENLNLLLKSPRLSREEKERAEAQKTKQEAEKANLETQKDEQEAIWKVATSVAGVLSKKPNGSVLLDNIQNAKTKEEALNLAAQYGAFAEAETQNTFEQRLDPQGNLVELELTPQGQVVNQRVITGKETRTTTASIPADTVASRLTAQGLSPAILATGNKLTKGNADAIAAKGVPPSIVELITQAILEGESLNDIRTALSEGHGQDIGFGYLDKYMGTLQEKESKGTKLDQLLKSL